MSLSGAKLRPPPYSKLPTLGDSAHCERACRWENITRTTPLPDSTAHLWPKVRAPCSALEVKPRCFPIPSLSHQLCNQPISKSPKEKPFLTSCQRLAQSGRGAGAWQGEGPGFKPGSSHHLIPMRCLRLASSLLNTQCTSLFPSVFK